MRRQRRHARGFTLIEAMVSIGIVALIGVLIYSAFDGMSRSRTTMTHINDRYHQGRSAVERIARELGSAYLSAHEPLNQLQTARQTAFIGGDEGGADRLDFDAFAHRRLARDAHESDQAEIGYFASRNPDGGIDLVRREQKHPDDDPSRGGVVNVLVENIDSFELRYLDPATGEWIDTWDTTQPAGQLDRLPAQVHIRLVLNDGPGGAPIVFNSKATLGILLPLKFAGGNN